MSNTASTKDYKQYLKLIVTAICLLVGIWFAHKILTIVFIFFLAVVLMLVLNAPTMWLVSKGVRRTAAALMIFFALLLFLALIGWLVIPRILEQVSSLITNLPQYVADLKRQLAAQLTDYPSLQSKILDDSTMQDNLPSVKRMVTGIGQFSLSLVSTVFLLIVFFSIVVYLLVNPAPWIKTYLTFFPEQKRGKAGEALARSSKMLVGWMWSNLLVGGMEAIAVFVFLNAMNVPGVWIWAGLAVFAEMVPKLGLYIMATPPVIIALTISPMTALWVLIFFLALNEIMGDFVMPRVRASTMNLHPVSSLFMMLALASAFGLIGALIATPVTVFVKAYYETFYLKNVSTDNLDGEVENILRNNT